MLQLLRAVFLPEIRVCLSNGIVSSAYSVKNTHEPNGTVTSTYSSLITHKPTNTNSGNGNGNGNGNNNWEYDSPWTSGGEEIAWGRKRRFNTYQPTPTCYTYP
ncbi:hypothetical protein G9A89_006079 [Geosiphon pyriformis]|nr:hypothetical protein G9A89_006079 [Geosiphon pyriformis]